MPTSKPGPVTTARADFLAALLSYVVPGLGQIYQGRIAKGILFLICVYVLFFYGMALGSWSNVYLPDAVQAKNETPKWPGVLVDLYNRPQFLGQFWVGAAVWPGIWQYMVYNENEERTPLFGTWQRTPFEVRGPVAGEWPTRPAPFDAKEKTLNELQTDGDKTWDLGWVFTVIAGVLNVMVIYDAFAGPAYTAAMLAQVKENEAKNAAGLAAATH